MSSLPKEKDLKSGNTASEAEGSVLTETKKTSDKPIDLTHLMPIMSAHDHVTFPEEGVQLSLTSEELEFILSTLTKVHTSLLDRVKDKTVAVSERKSAYEFALTTEGMYASIFKQLKLYKPEREDLN